MQPGESISLDTFYFENGMTLLTFAAHHGASKAVQALLENGANANALDKGVIQR